MGIGHSATFLRIGAALSLIASAVLAEDAPQGVRRDPEHGAKMRECEQHPSLLPVIPSASMNGEAVVLQPSMSTVPTMKLGTY